MTIDTDTRNNWGKLKSAFLSQYDARKTGLISSIELLKVRMKIGQSVNECVKELTELWSTTHCDDHTKLEIFVNGLLPYLQASTISTSPKTFLDAKAAACLYESPSGNMERSPAHRITDEDFLAMKSRIDKMDSSKGDKRVFIMNQDNE